MSNAGNNPKYNFFNLTPLSADPSNPEEGDIQFSDGTARAKGPWVYQDAAWQQFSTGAALSTVNNITFTPQSADPGSPTEGTIFYSDGTARAVGFWFYNGSDWAQVTGVMYQEFTNKVRYEVRAASTANVIIASQIENGDSFGGVTLVTNDIILLKNQTTTSENGIYVVQVSGAALRDSSFDDAAELSYAHAYVTSGTNSRTSWYQQNELSTLADAQSWTNDTPVYSFTVPQDKHELTVLANGGGGGGASGGNSGGGSGGAGASPELVSIKVTPGDVLSIQLGKGGIGGASSSGSNGNNGTDGETTSITGTGVNLKFKGAAGGNRAVGATSGAAQQEYSDSSYSGPSAGRGGAGGAGVGFASSGGTNVWTETGASPGSRSASPATGEGGGGGGPGLGAGGAGGNGGQNNSSAGSDAPDTSYGAGGGASGGRNAAGSTGEGGFGQDGSARLSWR